VKRLPSADPLEDSKMSFGEHLEELRSALWKAVIAIFLGFLIGLAVGRPFIRFVSDPLEAGLNEVAQTRQLEDYDAKTSDGAASDDPRSERGLAPKQFEIDPQDLIDALKSLGIQVAPPEELPESLPLWLWSEPEGQQLVVTETEAGFAIYIKASVVVGIVLASPAVFYFIWNFVAAGLYPHERRYVHTFLPLSIGLFLFGATFAFYVVLQYVISFLLGFNAWLGIETMPRINQWISFVLILPVAFGLSFQLPLGMLFLERIGVATTKLYVSYWKYAVLVIFVIAMVFSPPEPWSQIFMAVPLCFLYAGGILLCRLWPKSSDSSFEQRLADSDA